MENKTKQRNIQFLFKKAVIKRLRIPPNWIKSFSSFLNSVKSGSILNDNKKKYLLLIAIIALLGFLALRWQIVCFKYQSQYIIDKQCDAYTNGDVTGNLCNIFCNSKNRNKEENIPRDHENFNTGVLYPLEGCPNSFHGGKDVVFPAIISGSNRVYVKGYSDEEANDKVPLTNSEYLDITTFTQMINDYIQDNVAILSNDDVSKNDTSILEKLFPDIKLDPEDPRKNQILTMKTMWSLVQDDEYVFSKLGQDLNLFPTIYGSCGSLYIVEEVEPLSFKSASSWGKEIPFKEFARRATIAMAIMDYLDELDTVFDEPLHLCDVKTSHFGISKSGQIKFLDLDAVFAKSVLGKTMKQQGSLDDEGGNCTEHSDCSFFDCQGECDKIAGKCRSEVANNNLQVVCEKIFLGRPYLGVGNNVDLILKENGLLVSKHGHRKLNELLKTCSNPSKSKDAVRLATPDKVKMDLYKALEQIVNFMEDDENL